MRVPFFSSLFWKLASLFLVLLLLIGTAYTYLTFFQAEMIVAETNQRLNATLAQHIVDDIQPFVNGKPNYEALHRVFHNVMVVNPSVEVYLLDSTGTILSFSAPADKVKMKKVSLIPIKEVISASSPHVVFGDNPRNPEQSKVFSVAPVYSEGSLVGYVYVILGGEDYDSAADMIAESHYLSIGIRNLFLSLIAAMVVGVLAIGLITRKLRLLTNAVNQFTEGKLQHRVAITSRDEVDRLGRAFNEMADTIANNIEALQRADTLRRELIANISHDLRTPLASMQGYLETMLMKHDSLTADERIAYLKTTVTSGERLTNLVHELFDLSKLEARQSIPRPEVFSMAELIHDISMKASPQAQAKGISISVLAVQSNMAVRADIGMIERVIVNLLDNAMKFTPAGGIVTIEFGKESGKITTTIRDTGVGIEPQDLPRVFDRYFQSRNRESREGAGLGLAIVRKILELHNEEIHVTSTRSKGTSFVFSLPSASASG